MMLTWLVVFVVGLQVVDYGSAAKFIPPYVKLCKRHDPKLDDCYKRNFIEVMKHMGEGVPEMNLRKVNPLHVQELQLSFGNGTSVAFEAVLKDLVLYGIQKVKIEYVHIDLDNVAFTMGLRIPRLRMESEYTAQGKVLLLQFDTTGTFWGNFTDVYANGTWTGRKYNDKKGKEHIELTDSIVDMKIKKIEMYFDNLFPTQPEITITTNRAINENIDVLYDEVKPIIIETIKTIVLDSVNSVYKLFPLDTLYPLE